MCSASRSGTDSIVVSEILGVLICCQFVIGKYTTPWAQVAEDLTFVRAHVREEEDVSLSERKISGDHGVDTLESRWNP